MMTDVVEEKELYLVQFARFEKDQAAAPAWLRQLRHTAIDRFTELGFPGPRDEEWRFTSLRPLAEVAFRPAPARRVSAEDVRRVGCATGAGCRLVFVNGRFAADLSTLTGLPAGVRAGGLADALRTDGKTVEAHLARYARFHEQPFTALNTAFTADGAFLHLPKNAVVTEPIQLLFITTGGDEATVSHPRTLVLADTHSQARVVQCYVGLGEDVYFTNAVTEVVLAPGAVVDHYKLQRESKRAFHIETLQVRQDRASNFGSHAVTFGGGLVRNEVNAVLDAEGCECTLNGLYQADDRQHIDNHTFIDHAKPNCASHELYKGILDGRAHGVFNGKIFVRQDAQKTDAKQTNQTLLLSDDAVINTKPQLEIFADDVKCTHGATVGQLSAEALFYFRSRGVGVEEARRILTFAFANDVIRRVQVEPLRHQLEELLLHDRQLPADLDGQEAP
jgi:Fe-S cluster assembly protein SufD